MSEIGSSGTFVQSGSTTILSGGGSGLNTAALIEAAVAQRAREADLIDVRIAENDFRSAALSTLQSLGADLQTSLTSLRGAFGFSSTDGAIFNAKSGTLTSNTSVPAESLVSVAIDDTAEVGNHVINVRRTARERIVQSDTTTDPNVALGQNGTFQLYLDNATAVDVNVVGTDTLQDIADKINAVSDQTSVSASVVKINENDFSLVVSGTETGIPLRSTVGAGDDVLQSIGVLDGVASFKNNVQDHRTSEVRYNNIIVNRTDNNYDDLIQGVDIDILLSDVDTNLVLNIGNDSSAVKGTIEGFVEGYNALRDFVLQQQVVSPDGEVSEESVLFNDSLMDGLNRAVQGLFGRNFLGSGGIETLGEIGIEFDGNNRLTVDDSVLDDAIINNLEEVKGLFQAQYSDDNAEFNISVNESQTQSFNFALNITHDGSNITSVDVGGDTSLFTINGSNITGAAGTIYDGLVFAYVGTTSTTVNVSLEQGFADLGVNVLEGYVNAASGLIQQEKLAIDDQNDDLSQRADRVRERAEAFRQSLIDRYASFEAQLARANSLIDQIRAILGTDDNDN